MSTKPTKNIELYKKAASMVVYDKDEGTFVWLPKSKLESDSARWNSRHAGKGCGAVNPGGYRGIQFVFSGHGTFRVMAHRLAWFIVNGVIPEFDIDHINQDRLDNRISNLRDVSKSLNLRNKSMGKNNTSGVTGVTWEEQIKKWRARALVDGVDNNIGFFAEIEDAAFAVRNFREKNGFSENHGKAKP